MSKNSPRDTEQNQETNDATAQQKPEDGSGVQTIEPAPQLPELDTGVENEQGVQGGGSAEAGPDDADGDAQQDLGRDHGEDAPFGFKVDGTPRKSNRGRKSDGARDETGKQRARLRSVTPSTAKPSAKNAAVAQVTPLAVVNYQAMGESVASMFFSVGILAFGNDWKPNVEEGEPQAIAGAFRDYFKATNMRDLPPGFALCFVVGVYTLKRAAKPTMQSKLQLFGAWVKSKMPRKGLYSVGSNE